MSQVLKRDTSNLFSKQDKSDEDDNDDENEFGFKDKFVSNKHKAERL
jgi:hypothetical protein